MTSHRLHSREPLLGPHTQIDTKFGILSQNKTQISKTTKVRYYHIRVPLLGPQTQIVMKFGVLLSIKTQNSKITKFRYYHSRVPLLGPHILINMKFGIRSWIKAQILFSISICNFYFKIEVSKRNFWNSQIQSWEIFHN